MLSTLLVVTPLILPTIHWVRCYFLCQICRGKNRSQGHRADEQQSQDSNSGCKGEAPSQKSERQGQAEIAKEPLRIFPCGCFRHVLDTLPQIPHITGLIPTTTGMISSTQTPASFTQRLPHNLSLKPAPPTSCPMSSLSVLGPLQT